MRHLYIDTNNNQSALICDIPNVAAMHVDMTPGTINQSGKRINLHLDENDRLFYYKKVNGEYIKTYISSQLSSGSIDQDHTSKVDLGFIPKGFKFLKGEGIDYLIRNLFENSDYTVVKPGCNITFENTTQNNIIEVGTKDEDTGKELVQIDHSLNVINPKFISPSGVSFQVPDFQYESYTVDSNPVSVSTSVEKTIPITYTVTHNEYKAKDYNLSVSAEEGSGKMSDSVLVSNSFTYTDNIKVLYKWYFKILDYQSNPDNILFDSIKTDSLKSGWIDIIGTTPVIDSYTLQPGKCAVIAIPINNKISFSVKKLGLEVAQTWNVVEHAKGKSSYKLLYLLIPSTGVASEYTNLKINHT